MRPFLLLALLPALLLACSDDTTTTEEPALGQEVGPVAPDDLVAAADDAGLSTLIALADTAGLAATLRSEGPYTLFAPTNEAFAALPQATLDSLALAANRSRLERLLRYHVVPGRIGTDIPLPITVRTLAGAELTLDTTEGGYVVRDGAGNAVSVLTPDVNVSNGVVHVIDRVMMPPAQVDSTAD